MPPDMTAGFPVAAARLVDARDRLGARALEDAVAATPDMRERYDELGLRNLVRDTQVMVDRIAKAVASGDPIWTREWADWVAPVYRRRKVPMADVIVIWKALGDGCAAMLGDDARPALDAAIGDAEKVFRYYKRIAGDAGAKNPILNAIYRGV
jgi:hypothetical protein